MRVLVTAGNTRERIDQVRDWGNIFTGNTGLAIARAMADVADVDLLTSNRQHIADVGSQSFPHPLRPSPFTTHGELKGALSALLARTTYDAIFMTAAVADYRPAGTFAVLSRTPAPPPHDAPSPNPQSAIPNPQWESWLVQDVSAGKVKSTHPSIAVVGEPTEKIVDLFRTAWDHRGLLVKFKLEVGLTKDQLLAVGESSRRASDADYLVANTLDMVTGASAGAYLLSASSPPEWVPRDSLPARLRDLVAAKRSAAR